jgi:bacillopeptidase F (M6 metalloprotease family)
MKKIYLKKVDQMYTVYRKQKQEVSPKSNAKKKVKGGSDFYVLKDDMMNIQGLDYRQNYSYISTGREPAPPQSNIIK